MTLNEFNELPAEKANQQLLTCCGSSKWSALLMKHFPFESEKKLIGTATDVWYNHCDAGDWQQAFSHHPKIGDIKGLSEKFAGEEQSAVKVSSKETIAALASGNEEFEKKNGFIFIVCATGKSATEMLRLLRDRMQNSKEEELKVAMGEQHKITIIRFKKMLADANWTFLGGSQVTTHVLDTSRGFPGNDLTIRLQENQVSSWQTIAQGITNADGRIGDLLPPGRVLPEGVYRMIFETGPYFLKNDTKGFYPEVDIQFTISDSTHYHIPLLVSPYGYSTYRGS